MKKRTLLFFYPFLAILICYLNGCTLIGFGIGAAADASKPDYQQIPGWQVQSIKKGTAVNVILLDQEVVNGKFLGVRAIPLQAGDSTSLKPAIEVEVGDQSRLIPVKDVYQVEVPANKNSGKLAGLLVGAMIDATVIIIAASTMGNDEESTPSTTNTSFSCPFVYSFDGAGYRLDSEPFGGSIFKAAQRPDWDNLDYLQEVNGTYRLKITNELQETQYVDEVKLLAVEHPKNTRVIPSFSGTLHTLANPQPPVAAQDFQGAEVLNLVNRGDNEFWISNPFGRDANAIQEVRDGVILEFPRPASAKTAKLALRAQNTLWASYLQGQMLKLHGRDLDQWYVQMNQSPEARKALTQAMIREGMLLVKVWNGEDWQTADFVWEVGPNLPKEQVVWLSLANLPGDKLTLSLESTAGFWMVDYAAVDYTPDVAVTVQELSPLRSLNHRQTDVLPALQAADEQYYVMETGDRAEIVFEAPPRNPALSRSCILKATGYYTINVYSDSEPQTGLIQAFFNEPGKYGQFTLGLLDQYTGNLLAQTGGERK